MPPEIQSKTANLFAENPALGLNRKSGKLSYCLQENAQQKIISASCATGGDHPERRGQCKLFYYQTH
jgi:hypothetical protein